MKTPQEYALTYSLEGDAEELLRDIQHNGDAIESVAIVLEMQDRLSGAEWRRLKNEIRAEARR